MKNLHTFIILFCILQGRMAFANHYLVTNNFANGTGSLNQAITNANTHIGKDTINFAIPFTSPAQRTITLNPLFGLPDITDPLVIDGTTQSTGNAFGISSAKIG